MKQLLSIPVILIFTILFASAQTKARTQKAAPGGTPKQTQPAVNNEQNELKPVTPEKGKEIIAIYHFTTSAGYAYDYALSAGTAVEGGFVRSGRFTVVERNRFGIITDEEKFKEANTAEIVKKAAKLGAKTLVTGHIIAVTTGVSPGPLNILTNISQISLAFKIINVESGEIEKSETILGKGNGSTQAESMKKAYDEIDRLARAQVASYLPQRFEYSSEVEVDKKGRLQKFKIWGGASQGLKEGDLIEIYEISYITNPTNGKKIQEKKLLGQAKIKEVNSSETATCELQKANTIGEQLLNSLRSIPASIVFEYKGTVRKQGLFN